MVYIKISLHVKHFNNLIEQAHRHLKSCFVKTSGFQNLRHASRTLKGTETIHAIKNSDSMLRSFDVQKIATIIQNSLNDNHLL